MSMRKLTGIILLCAVLALVFLLSSCVKDDPTFPTGESPTKETQTQTSTAAVPSETPEPDRSIKTLRLSKNGLTLKTGTSERLTFSASPEGADVSLAEWTSDDPLVASVDPEGKVTGVSVGRTVVRLTCGPIMAECTVVVTDEEMTVIPVVSVRFAEPVVTLTEGNRESLQYNVQPINATDRSVTFTVADESVATVDVNGKLEGKTPGLTRVTVKSGSATATCVVVVKKSDGSLPAAARGEISVEEGQSRSLETGFSEYSKLSGVTYHSADPLTATAVEGILKGLKIGRTMVEMKNADGKVVFIFDVTVVEKGTAVLPVEGIRIDPAAVSVEVGGKVKLTATLLPEGARNAKIVWICENREIYSVSENGEITGLKPGSAVVTAYVEDGGKTFTKTCAVTVREKGSPDVVYVTGLTVVKDSFTLKVGEQVQIEYVVMPKDATKKKVEFIIEPSSDLKGPNGEAVRDYLTVDASGKVTAQKACKGCITLYISDGGKSFTKCVWFTITE